MSNSVLALAGGVPVRSDLLPYGRQQIDVQDIDAVVAALRGAYITGGPLVGQFEAATAQYVGSRQAVALANGTAALHAVMAALGIGPGDEVIVPSLTFVATANCVVYQGARPVFADVEEDSLLISPQSVEAAITPRTKAIIAVDYAGQPCDYTRLREITQRYGLALIADACHALGAEYQGQPVGGIADATVFSFHPVKAMTTGEGGMVSTDDSALAARVRTFRNHGMSRDFRQREEGRNWSYSIDSLGYNYRITDIQCALGLSQLKRLSSWLARRREIADAYQHAFAPCGFVQPLTVRRDRRHAYHLYVIKLKTERLAVERDMFLHALRAEGIGANVHYYPVHLQPFYRQRFGTDIGMCPMVERASERILSLPMFSSMTDRDVQDVIQAVMKLAEHYAKRAE